MALAMQGWALRRLPAAHLLLPQPGLLRRLLIPRLHSSWLHP
jgi:hypothetical protein